MRQISQKALQFLEDLSKNNNRDWFNEHKSYFKDLEKEMKLFYNEVGGLMNEHDRIQKIKAYRIYRDIRFSKDKTPYKIHFACIFIRQQPELRGSYYLHIQPGNKSRLGAGFWNPNREDLERVRKEWEIDGEEVRTILKDEIFKKYWGEMRGEQLKTAPRGFDKNHPNIDLINYKQWLFLKEFTDEEILAPDFTTTVNEYFIKLRPFFNYMSDVLTTDLNGESIL